MILKNIPRFSLSPASLSKRLPSWYTPRIWNEARHQCTGRQVHGCKHLLLSTEVSRPLVGPDAAGVCTCTYVTRCVCTRAHAIHYLTSINWNARTNPSISPDTAGVVYKLCLYTATWPGTCSILCMSSTLIRETLAPPALLPVGKTANNAMNISRIWLNVTGSSPVIFPSS